MDSLCQNKAVVAGMYVMLCLGVFLIFQFNFLQICPQGFFETHQINGQARVLGGIVADAHGLNKGGARLGKLYVEKDISEQEKARLTHRIFASYPSKEQVKFNPYPTQYGLQEIVYSFLYRHFGLTGLGQLQSVSAFLTAASLVIILFLYRKIYGGWFSWLFFLSLVLCPWFIAMARNLYWSPFLIFLPAIFATLIYLSNNRRMRVFLFVCLGATLLIKSLTNYEYLTTVTLLACSVFIVGPYFDKDNSQAKMNLKMALMAFTVCVLGFSAAFLIHADSRGNTFAQGVKNIYEQDVQRRTFGDPSRFTEKETVESLNASIKDVLKVYYLEWPERRRMILPGKLFLVLNALALAGLLFKFFTRYPDWKKDAALFFVFLAVPVSWFVFAKGHSYTQTHINFVLWYIGFIPALLFVAGKSLSLFCKSFFSRIIRIVGFAR